MWPSAPTALTPDELNFLHTDPARGRKRWSIIAAVTVVCVLIPLLLPLLSDSMRTHLAGDTEQVSAEVTSVQPVGNCRGGQRHSVAVTWMSDGLEQSGAYTTCEDPPQVGASVTLWIGAGGNIQTNSPTGDRIGLIALSVALGLLAIGAGALAVVPLGRRRRRLLRSVNHALDAVGPVETKYHGRYDELHIRLAGAHVAGPPATRRAKVTLRSQFGAKPIGRGHRELRGAWQAMYVVRADQASKYSVALLARGPQRCWVEFRNRGGK
ncbi:hypothetical protein [Cumulibacter soli]|uniref:hypothetical protein n=1 Tax=Cumulibacter soli TaxID=2546344 RepID=UPI00106798B9|nr:hypothetical protein [Cumulibacter soli]